MYTMIFDITIGNFKLGMLDRVTVHKSVELLADTAQIVLPGAEYNAALQIEDKLKRGDKVCIKFGYEETGLETEFEGWLQRITTDGGSLTLTCEDDLFLYRKRMDNQVLQKCTLKELLETVVRNAGQDHKVSCTYDWTYSKFVINNATGYDVLKKVQEESGADIYIKDGTLHVHSAGERIGEERLYDFGLNVEKTDLSYRKLSDKRLQVTVKANMPTGYVKEIDCGSAGGDKIEIKCPTSDEASMKARGELEVRRRSFDGYEGSITGWLVPMCKPGDSAVLRDRDYEYKDGTYFVAAVTTEFGRDGGKRKVTLGFKLS